MRVSSERKAETRGRILEAAGALFRSHGIDAVGVDAIMHEAGLTHGGFYAHFASKEALVAEVSAASLARAAARWERISQEADHATALARIVESYLDPAHVAAAERGCVLATLGPEMARRRELAVGDNRLDPPDGGCALPLPSRRSPATRAGGVVRHGGGRRPGEIVGRSCAIGRIPGGREEGRRPSVGEAQRETSRPGGISPISPPCRREVGIRGSATLSSPSRGRAGGLPIGL